MVEPMTPIPKVYEQTDRESVGDTVIRAVADRKGVDPLELDECLYDVIEPAALDALCGSGAREKANPGETRVSFVFEGYRVTADGSGTITLSETEATACTQSRTGQAVLSDPTSSWRRVFQQL
jgi:hypothetical protein